MQSNSKRGRPRLASKEMLQEAAFELFQLRGYKGTSVEMIARTAGFSRATFFNFFSSKAELFWVETDVLIERMSTSLEVALSADPAPTVPEALLEFAATLNSGSIPWALQNYRLLEAADDLIASGASRVLGLTRIFRNALRRQQPECSAAHLDAQAAALTAVLLSAVLGWIDAGVHRGDLRARLETSLAGAAALV